jgi:hypothetical protein
MANLTDEQIDLLAKQAGEVTRLQAIQANERTTLLERHAKERADAKVEIVNANQPSNYPTR